MLGDGWTLQKKLVARWLPVAKRDKSHIVRQL